MEMYYTKREYNKMKNTLTSENKRLKKQIIKLQKKLNDLEYSKEVTFEPDFVLTPMETGIQLEADRTTIED